MDRFTRGLVAGIIGGIAMNLWTLIAVNILKWHILRFIDWASVVLYGTPPKNYAEGIFALFMQLLWSGVLGVILSFLFLEVTSRFFLLKGTVFGIFVGFLTYAIPILLRTPFISSHSFLTVVSNHIGGLIWGLITAYCLQLFDIRLVKY